MVRGPDLGVGSGGYGHEPGPRGPRIGRPSPSFLLQSSEGSPVQLGWSPESPGFQPAGSHSGQDRALCSDPASQPRTPQHTHYAPSTDSQAQRREGASSHSTLSLVFLHPFAVVYAWVEGLLRRPYLQIVPPQIHDSCLPKRLPPCPLWEKSQLRYLPFSARAFWRGEGGRLGWTVCSSPMVAQQMSWARTWLSCIIQGPVMGSSICPPAS